MTKERLRGMQGTSFGSPSNPPQSRLPHHSVACIDNDGFETPELNDKLFLHFAGFRRIENLEEYTSLKGAMSLLDWHCCLIHLRVVSHVFPSTVA